MSDRPARTGAPEAGIRPDAKAAGGEHFWEEARAVFVKDFRSELRTRAALATILLFSVVTLTLVALTVPHQKPPLIEKGLDTEARTLLLDVLFWIVLFFSAMAGLPRTFVKEEETRTATALRLAARPGAVLTGKLLFNAALLLIVVAVVLPLFLILFTPQVKDWGLFLLYAVAGALGMAGSATILGAIVARAGGKSYLMLPLAFPILLPMLMLAIGGTARAMLGNGGNPLVALVSYLVAMVTLSAMLFEKVWTDR
jgi:heme exporter protein B